MILKGKPPAREIKEAIKKNVDECLTTPKLVTISVAPDPSTRSYINSQAKAAKKLGIDFQHRELTETSTLEDLKKAISESNDDDTIHGILLAMPLPAGFDKREAVSWMNPAKDVEGITPTNLGLLFYESPFYYPCTAEAVLVVLSYYNIPLKGKDITIIGRSTTVGRPLTLMMLERSKNATPRTCHTKTVDIEKKIRESEILIVAAGKHGVVTTEMLSDDTIVIDVGINFIDGHLTGDVKRNKALEEEKNISITPVPGGIGSITTALLMSNVVSSCLAEQLE